MRNNPTHACCKQLDTIRIHLCNIIHVPRQLNVVCGVRKGTHTCSKIVSLQNSEKLNTRSEAVSLAKNTMQVAIDTWRWLSIWPPRRKKLVPISKRQDFSAKLLQAYTWLKLFMNLSSFWVTILKTMKITISAECKACCDLWVTESLWCYGMKCLHLIDIQIPGLIPVPGLRDFNPEIPGLR